ncbi:MAG: 2-oxoacid:acceptor oxidoreductase family protein [Ruminiclostridium sp.]|nr:2-oxoacid:ferredoxin oxidoreductase subunit gamma [Oscillospiraceae bacterium]MBQ2798760.1 2-oxoacid:acceptor oxidoreductase family protein [Ruminiclostridium sp.]
MTNNILLAGFGGQGILFIGKMLAYFGLIDEKEVSWLPSYGPEMRGGTCNCSVVVSDDPIGSPLVDEPDLLIAMNTPSYDKFIDTVVKGGKVFIDSTLVDAKCDRTDIDCYYVPATGLAAENNMKGMANIILLGKLLKETGIASMETVEKAMNKVIPPKKAHLIEVNLKAIKLGMEQ